MKLRIGDKVRFLNEVGEGVVSQIKDKFTVYVEMNDGFEKAQKSMKEIEDKIEQLKVLRQEYYTKSENTNEVI